MIHVEAMGQANLGGWVNSASAPTIFTDKHAARRISYKDGRMTLQLLSDDPYSGVGR